MARRNRQQARRASVLLSLALGAVNWVLATPQPAWAATQKVAVVVQTDAKSQPSVSCVPWTKGMTGFDLLRAADHDIAWQAKTYKMLQIDAVPTPAKADATHYWAYFTRPDGKDWMRSTKTGATSLPQPGTVEAWLYYNGTAYAPPKVTFSYACGIPVTTSSRTAAATATPSASSAKASPPPRASASGSRRPSTARSTPRPATSSTANRTSGAPAPTTAAASGRTTGAQRRNRATSGPLLGFAFGGLLLAIAVASGAVAYQRRRGPGT